MFAPGVPRLMKDFNSTNIELASFVVSIYILGFAFGPLYDPYPCYVLKSPT
jgi:MFS family permease